MALASAFLALDLGVDTVRAAIVHALSEFRSWIADGHARAPALMAGLAVGVVVPLLALGGLFLTRLSRSGPRPDAVPIRTEAAAAAGLGWPCEAWVMIDGTASSRRPVPRELLSIGREDDNDLRLDDASVHRHHAVLHRNSDSQFLIRDLSGQDGNGVKVNGERIRQIALKDGDRIEIGRVVLRFEATPA